MNYRLLALSLLAVACAQPPAVEGSLIENHGPTSAQVKGLLRTAAGPFVRGQVETLTAVYDAAHVRSVKWSASGGSLSSKEARVSWTLPDLEQAALTVTLTLDDGSELVTGFDFWLVEAAQNTHVARTAREALLATPMPVLDGGSNEISGGACDMEYDASANVHLAFTSGTHPTVYYGRWNGSAWTLEVMDTLGFNTGGRIEPSQVHLRVDATGNPHILYLRDGQLWYATKSGSVWTRERVDNTTQYLDSTSNTASLGLNATGRPSVIYEMNLSSSSRLVFATRTAANTWTATTLNFSPLGTTTYSSRVRGDLLFNAAGTAYFPAEVYGSGNGGYYNYLASWSGTAVEVKAVTNTLSPGWDLSGSKASSGVWASTGRALYRTSAGLYDISIAAPLTNSTYTWSANESGGAGVGDLAWNGRPVMLHHHGSNLELVAPSSTGAAFWTWTQLGASTGVSGAVVVHPTTGVASICYQAGGRVMFQ